MSSSAPSQTGTALLSNRVMLIEKANAWLLRPVPAVSARTLAVYRITLAGMLVYFWNSLEPQGLTALRSAEPLYHMNSFDFLKGLAQLEWIPTFVFHGVTILLICLILGVFTKFVFPLLVLFFWLAALLMNKGHFMTPLLLGLTATIPVRWSDDLSLDRLLGLARPVAGRSKLYGYPIWLLGLAIGLAYAAAGLSKILITDGAWLWGTGARWGFITDLNVAATDWGIWFVNNYWLALLASIFASFGQIAYLYASFTRSARIKAAIGIFIAFPFLIGLILFMGLFWWPWFVLVVLLYIPWPQLARLWDRREAKAAPLTSLSGYSGHRTWLLCAAWLMLASHAVAVLVQREYEPLISNYPMYALSFPANSEFERKQWAQYVVHGRNFVYDVDIVVDDQIRSLGHWHRFAKAISEIYHLAYVKLSPGYVWSAAAQGEAIAEGVCKDLHSVVATSIGQGASELRYSRRYYEVEEGLLRWVEPDQVLVVDLAEPDCGYAFEEAITISWETGGPQAGS